MLAKIAIGVGAAALVFSIYSVSQISAVNTKLEEEISSLKLMIQTGASKNNASSNGLINEQGVQAITLDQSPNMNMNNPTAPTSMVPTGPLTSIKFTQEVHSFGTVQEESENMYSFTFTNTGKEPLIIQDAKGSCGCTVPNYPKQPIMPGKTGTIDVKFTPYKGQIGPAEKTVTVTANTEPATTIVKIQANVVEKK
jgi:hypothetical protein